MYVVVIKYFVNYLLLLLYVIVNFVEYLVYYDMLYYIKIFVFGRSIKIVFFEY